MDRDTLIGCILVAGALGCLTYLLFWSRRTINRIARHGYRSAREIRRELHDGE
jgi:hypothetical protein